MTAYLLLDLGALRTMPRCGFVTTATATGRPSGRSLRRSSPPGIPMRTIPGGRRSRPGASGSRLILGTRLSPATDRGCSARRRWDRIAPVQARTSPPRASWSLATRGGMASDGRSASSPSPGRRIRGTPPCSSTPSWNQTTPLYDCGWPSVFRSSGPFPRRSHTQHSAASVFTSCTGDSEPDDRHQLREDDRYRPTSSTS